MTARSRSSRVKRISRAPTRWAFTSPRATRRRSVDTETPRYSAPVVMVYSRAWPLVPMGASFRWAYKRAPLRAGPFVMRFSGGVSVPVSVCHALAHRVGVADAAVHLGIPSLNDLPGAALGLVFRHVPAGRSGFCPDAPFQGDESELAKRKSLRLCPAPGGVFVVFTCHAVEIRSGVITRLTPRRARRPKTQAVRDFPTDIQNSVHRGLEGRRGDRIPRSTGRRNVGQRGLDRASPRWSGGAWRPMGTPWEQFELVYPQDWGRSIPNFVIFVTLVQACRVCPPRACGVGLRCA